MSGRSTDSWTACCPERRSALPTDLHASPPPPPTSRNVYRGVPLHSGCTMTPNRVGPNCTHSSFCSEPFGQDQHRTLGIASVPQGTKLFIALKGRVPVQNNFYFMFLCNYALKNYFTELNYKHYLFRYFFLSANIN